MGIREFCISNLVAPVSRMLFRVEPRDIEKLQLYCDQNAKRTFLLEQALTQLKQELRERNQNLVHQETPQYTRKYRVMYFFGSGSSLFQISEEEKQKITRADDTAVCALNKYFLFWRKIGIWPDYVALFDYHEEAIRLLWKMYNVANRESSASLPPPTFFLSNGLRLFSSTSYAHSFCGVGEWAKPYKNWAASAEEPMHWMGTSVTSMLNFLGTLKIANEIRLLGVDLVNSPYFYHDEIMKSQHDDIRTKPLVTTTDGSYHPTAKLPHGPDGILNQFAIARNGLKTQGVELFVSNKSSLLYTSGTLPYRDICD